MVLPRVSYLKPRGVIGRGALPLIRYEFGSLLPFCMFGNGRRPSQCSSCCWSISSSCGRIVILISCCSFYHVIWPTASQPPHVVVLSRSKKEGRRNERTQILLPLREVFYPSLLSQPARNLLICIYDWFPICCRVPFLVGRMSIFWEVLGLAFLWLSVCILFLGQPHEQSFLGKIIQSLNLGTKAGHHANHLRHDQGDQRVLWEDQTDTQHRCGMEVW